MPVYARPSDGLLAEHCGSALKTCSFENFDRTWSVPAMGSCLSPVTCPKAPLFYLSQAKLAPSRWLTTPQPF